MLVRRVRCEGAGSDTTGAVDFHDFALLRFENISGRFQSQLFDCFAEDFLRGGVNQEAIIEHHAQWIVPNYEPDSVLFIKYRKDERLLDLFSHRFQAVKVEGFLLFEKLNGNVAVRLNTRHWQTFFHS